MFKKRKKTSKLDFLSPTVFSPLENIVNSASTLKNSFYDSLEYIKDYLKGANILRKDLYSANVNLAKYHLANNNIFDAKFRYYVAHKMRKTSLEPILGLAEIAILQKKNTKAKKYFNDALQLVKSEQQKQEIMNIMQEL